MIPTNRTLFSTTTLALLALTALATSCGKTSDGSRSGRQFAIPAARKEANEVFQSLCVTCHGTTGHGDGPGAAACDPRPRSFSDPAWQASVTDEQIQKTVLFGGGAVGKSAQMPAQPQLKGKTELLQHLVAIVRGFAAR